MEFILHHLFFTTPYRCRDCDQRYFRRRISNESTKAAPEHSPTTHAPHSA